MKLSHRISVLLLLICVLLAFASCHSDQKPSDTDSNSAASQSEENPVDTAPPLPSFPYSIVIEDGSKIDITLPVDPEYAAELHLAALSAEDAPHRILILTESEEDLSRESVLVFGGITGNLYDVASIQSILSEHLTTEATDTHWVLQIGGTEYKVDKEQFADVAEEDLLDAPDYLSDNHYYVDKGQLLCRVTIRCTTDPQHANASQFLLVRYGIEQDRVVATEISFRKSDDIVSISPSAE